LGPLKVVDRNRPHDRTNLGKRNLLPDRLPLNPALRDAEHVYGERDDAIAGCDRRRVGRSETAPVTREDDYRILVFVGPGSDIIKIDSDAVISRIRIVAEEVARTIVKDENGPQNEPLPERP